MSVGPASAPPDHAKATRLPSGDNAGGPSTPGYEARGNSRIGALTGPSRTRQASAAATIATIARAPTAILARVRRGTHSNCGGFEGTTGCAVFVGEAEFASKTGT